MNWPFLYCFKNTSTSTSYTNHKRALCLHPFRRNPSLAVYPTSRMGIIIQHHDGHFCLVCAQNSVSGSMPSHTSMLFHRRKYWWLYGRLLFTLLFHRSSYFSLKKYYCKLIGCNKSSCLWREIVQIRTIILIIIFN